MNCQPASSVTSILQYVIPRPCLSVCFCGHVASKLKTRNNCCSIFWFLSFFLRCPQQNVAPYGLPTSCKTYNGSCFEFKSASSIARLHGFSHRTAFRRIYLACGQGPTRCRYYDYSAVIMACCLRLQVLRIAFKAGLTDMAAWSESLQTITTPACLFVLFCLFLSCFLVVIKIKKSCYYYHFVTESNRRLYTTLTHYCPNIQLSL